MKDYIVLTLVFLAIFTSINAEVSGAPATMGYVIFSIVFIAGLLAYRRHQSNYVKSMLIASIIVQLIFFLAIPYWVIKNYMPLNVSWPYFPEVLWETGALILWYYIVSFIFIPVSVYLFGRRAWCSFICGTGVLAETLGDKYRIKGQKGCGIHPAFTIIRWLIVIITVVFTVLIFTSEPQNALLDMVFLFFFILFLRTVLLNVVNIILMPKFGTRIWCKYFCPQGLLIGLISRLGRFTLVRDKELCTNCNTCNNNCSMDINISGGPEINRSTDCVGCGVCVEVCPQQALSMQTGIPVKPEKEEKIIRA